MNIAKAAGAKTAVVTAQAAGGAARRADVVLLYSRPDHGQ